VLGYERFIQASTFTVEVVSGDGTILERSGREETVRIAMLLNDFLRNNPENFGPNLADGMDTPIVWLVEDLVSRRVDALILKL
jgi:hypothetical protein